MRRQSDSKSNTCTESLYVDAAGISVKVERITRGDLQLCFELLSSRDDGKKLQKSAEGIVGSVDRTEGPNMK